MTEKPILAVDIDDVLASFVDSFILFLKEKKHPVKREDIRGSFLEMGIPDKRFDEFHAAGGLKTLPPVEGAPEAVRQLAEYFKIISMTSRPIIQQPVTVDWVKAHFPEIREMTFTREKGAACERLGVWGLVEDQTRFAKQFKNSFIIAAPWNTDWTGPRGDWKEMAELILRQLAKEKA